MKNIKKIKIINLTEVIDQGEKIKKDSRIEYIPQQLHTIWEQNHKKGYLCLRFTDMPERQAGINPKYSFSTPLGIYAYPFNPKFIEFLLNDTTFADNMKGMVIFIYNPIENNKVSVVLDNNGEAIGYNQQKYDSDYKILFAKEYNRITKEMQNYEENNPKYTQFNKEKLIKNIQLDFQMYSNNARKRTLFNIIYNISRNIAHNAKEWTSIMRNDLGYAAILDINGSETLHSSEPSQICIFEPKGINVVYSGENLIYKYKQYNKNNNESNSPEVTLDLDYQPFIEQINKQLKNKDFIVTYSPKYTDNSKIEIILNYKQKRIFGILIDPTNKEFYFYMDPDNMSFSNRHFTHDTDEEYNKLKEILLNIANLIKQFAKFVMSTYPNTVMHIQDIKNVYSSYMNMGIKGLNIPRTDRWILLYRQFKDYITYLNWIEVTPLAK